MNQKVAFFDIDGTVFRSSLLIELVEKMVEVGVFPESARAEYINEFQSWLNREGSYEAYINAVVATFMHHIKGVHYGEMADYGREVVRAHNKRVYRYTRDLMRQLKAEGYYLIAISQSPKAILDEFCKDYGFDKVYGRMYELGPSDRFTGVVLEEHLIQNKANIVNRVFDRHDFDRTDTYAVGDTEGDISMLEMVDRPICFNPNKVLFDHANREDWTVIIERKDVIYEL